jgi:hypothetical protein
MVPAEPADYSRPPADISSDLNDTRVCQQLWGCLAFAGERQMSPAIGAAVIGAAAAIGAAIIGVRHRGGEGDGSLGEEVFPRDLGSFFLAGCGVGNAITVLPVSFGQESDTETEGSDDGSLLELLDALKTIGLSADELAPLSRMLELGLSSDGPSPSDDDKRAVLEYFDAMRALPAAIRARSSELEFLWFKLGQLLYASAVIATLDIASGQDQARDSGELRALEFLAERPELPEGLRDRLRHFIAAARTGDGLERVYDEANSIALSVISLIR